MSITYHADTAAKPKPPFMLALMAINVAFVGLVLGAWSYVAAFVSEPIAWATWIRVYRSGTALDMFEYPFSMLWAMPLCFLAMAWVSDRVGARGLAWTCLSIPIVLHTLILAWFHLAPPDWR